VICTAGGSSDDFVRDEFTMRISSQRVYTMSDEGPVMQLEPNLDHLIELMTQAIEQPRIAERARAAGPQFVRENFTWRHVVDKLVDVLFPKS
jgi:hypothetical protein